MEEAVPDWVPRAFRESGGNELAKLREHWPELVAHCGTLQPTLRRHLRDSWPVSVGDTVLAVGFDPEFAEEIQEVRLMDHGTLHTLFSQVMGRSLRLDFQVLDKPVTWSHVQGGGADEPEVPFQMDSAGTDPAQWLKNETVRKVLEVFNGELVDIQPTIPTQGEESHGEHDENAETGPADAGQNAETTGRTG